MPKYIAAVRFGMMLQTENFVSNIDGLTVGTTVIIRSSRGVDWGEIASPVKTMERDVKGLGEIIRVASEDDIGIIQHIRDNKEPEEIKYCQEKIQQLGLDMRLVGVEHLFGGDKVIFYFLADGRVDFRELVKDLARSYRTRIEMRQIGVRDESRLLGDFGHCGRELCCRTFMHHLEPVTMRMAKMQKTTLDPTKISGHCGRLMCCLRFEDEVYLKLRKELPPRGCIVITPQLSGMIVDRNLLKQELLVQLRDGAREWIHVSEITEIRKKSRKNRKETSGQANTKTRDNDSDDDLSQEPDNTEAAEDGDHGQA